MWPFRKKSLIESSVAKLEAQVGSLEKENLVTSPTAKLYPEFSTLAWNSVWGAQHPFKIRFYRFLRDSVPILNSALWTWTRLCASPSYVQIKGSDEPEVVRQAEEIIADLNKRIYQPVYQKSGGVDALITQFFNSLFTDGMVCGEIVLTPAGDKIDRFYFIDPVTLCFELKDGLQWEIFQEQEGRKVKLNPDSTFYFGLDAEVNSPVGKSLLTAVPFVSRIEQQLVSDMQKTMHNAGYHRLHVQIKPPERSQFESDEAYVSRANNYFQETVKMMRSFSPNDNPVTWNDVEIKYIGPESRQAASTAWYINHKAMLEDVAAGLHLDPFMLGYSYGTNQTWAGFKFDLVQKNVVSLQRVAKRFLEWVRNIELALHGLTVEAEHHFDNQRGFGRLESVQVEKMELENIIKRQDKGYIDFEAAQKLANDL
ncbi:MAG: hypothetical protein A2Z27_00290 [candidate division Zixibacteria bacterium RBG_16_50_21]|nr:MAG: hypothetical protein A2Z27_00290 [candidate division Zixibacteria bacterium RBG_16_50_21]